MVLGRCLRVYRVCISPLLRYKQLSVDDGADGVLVKYFSQATSTAIIRVTRDHYRLVWAALSFVTRLPKPLDQPCVMQVVRVSGTIRKAEEEAIRRARLSIRRAQRAATSSTITGTANGVVLGARDDDDDLDMMNGIEDRDGPGDVDQDSDEMG